MNISDDFWLRPLLRSLTFAPLTLACAESTVHDAHLVSAMNISDDFWLRPLLRSLTFAPLTLACAESTVHALTW